MKIGIIREGKTPHDKRVPLTPGQCVEVMSIFPDVDIVVQPSFIRCFNDKEYEDLGISLEENLEECDVLLGIKEVNTNDLIPEKIYFFFSHTLKKQAYNRKLLQSIIEKNIQLVDYETLKDNNGNRIIGFGRFAGLIGAYNGFRAYGLKYNLFEIKPAYKCKDLGEMLQNLEKINLPPVKIAVTGHGRVASGVLEILNYLKIMRVSPHGFLYGNAPQQAIYVQLLPGNYVERIDGKQFDMMHFFSHPEMYKNIFLPYSKTTDLLIASAFWDPAAPKLFSAKEMNTKEFRIKVISDITCDIDGSIPSTKKTATINDPFYDYNPQTGKLEEAFSSPMNITIQAVDNLPCELPKDASADFGRKLIDNVFPYLFGEDADGIIERASITKNGELTKKFAYLQDFVESLDTPFSPSV